MDQKIQGSVTLPVNSFLSPGSLSSAREEWVRWLACHVFGLNWPYESELLWTLQVPGALVFCPAFLFLEGGSPVFPSLAEGVPSAVPLIHPVTALTPAAHRSPSLNKNPDRNGPPVSQDSFCDMGKVGARGI